MTEAEWLAMTVVPLWYQADWDAVTPSRRKATLFGVACVRATPGVEGQRRLLKAAAGSEAAADAGEWGEVERLHRAASSACGKVRQRSAAHHWALAACGVTSASVERYWPEIPEELFLAVETSGRSTRGLHLAYVALLHDIAGNPFRPVAFSPSWRSDTAVSLARGMYESRDFSAMPILADALQEAGCDSEDVLNHCRDPKGGHVRGCWVVDLVLGRV